MSWRIKDKQAARKATVAAQAAAVVLIASGAAMAGFGQRLLKVEEPAAAPGPVQADEQEGEGAGETARVFDPVAVDQNLGAIANAPVPDPVLPKEDEILTEAAPAEERAIRYVGSVQVGARAAAFMNIAGVTKLLRPGQTYEGVRLVSVEGERVVIAVNDGEEQSVEKSERQGPAVSVLVGGAPAPPAGSPMVAGEEASAPATFTPDMSREERRAALIERAREDRGRWERQRGEGGPPDREQR